MAITIAIPFYNAEKYLYQAIQSVFAQTFLDWELLLIDDGSTDESLKIAKSINDPRVRVISDGKNKRLAGRLNEVTHLAKYDYIARMDADDLMDPDRLKMQYEILENNPTYDIVTSGVFSVRNDLSIVGKRGTDYKGVNFEEIISRKKGVTHAALLARKSWYERHQYNETLKIAQDLDLWIRSSYKNDLNVIAISNPLYIYREEDNVTYDKLLRAYANERKSIYTYKGYNNLYFKSLAKSGIVKTLQLFNIQKDFQKNRNSNLTPEDIKHFNHIIQVINNTKVPVH